MGSQNSTQLKQTPASQGMIMPVKSHFKAKSRAKDLTSYPPAIHKCPIEILAEIFMYYLEDKGCQIEHLLLVCSHWYHMITLTPLFWTKITVSICSPVRPTAASQLRYLKTYMQRSKDMLLDIEVRCEKRTIPGNDWRDYGPVMDLLSDSIYRSKTLRVTLPWDFNLGGVVCTIFKGPAPHMVKLSVRNFNYRSHQLVSFSELPGLRILEIDIYAFMEMVRLHHSLPLAGLLSLDVELFGFTIWVASNRLGNWTTDISLLRSLRSLQIRYTGLGGRVHPKGSTQSPISLPLLQNLGLWGLEQLELKLELPALRTLSFDGVEFPKADPIEVIWRLDRAISTVNRHVIQDMILQYRSAKLFVVPVWAEWVLVDALHMMRREGSIPDSNVSFMRESKDGRRKPINI
jgi:hypothetical protein